MPLPARPWLSLSVLTLLLAGYATLALASGLDRAGQTANSSSVPSVLRAETIKTAAAQAIEDSDADRALQLAGDAVSANPGDAQALGLLGAAQLASGDRAGATRAFGVAGQRGWRDLSTQLFGFDSAVRAQDWPVAARRIDAVLRVRPSLPEMNSLLAAVEMQGSAAQAALAERVALKSSWQKVYLDGLSALSRAQLFARGEVLASDTMAKAALACGQIAPMAAALRAAKGSALASRIWRSHCNAADMTDPVLDTEFALLSREGELPGLGWAIEPSGDMDVDVAGVGVAPAVTVENVGVRFALALSQRTYLPAGRYRIVALDTDGRALPAIRAAVSCAGKRELPPSAFVDGQENAVSVASNCDSQLLTLWVAPGAGRQTIGRVQVRPVS